MADLRRIAVLATHPIHYQIQIYKRLAAVPGMDVTMLFSSRFGIERQTDHTVGIVFQWYDGSILDGCKHKFLKNYPLATLKSPLGAIAPGVVSEVTRAGYDVVLVQGYATITDWLALAAARWKGVPILFRGETRSRSLSPGRLAFARPVVMRALSKAVDVFLPIGTRSKEFYLRYGIPEERLVLSPYAVDNDYFSSKASELASRRDEIHQALGVPQDLPVVLSVSRLTPRKRPMDLLRAFEGLQTPASLVYVGDGPLRPEMEAFVASRKMKNVFCLGFRRQEDLPQFYAIADVFVLASEDEPWGLVINEAMCFSLPIVTTYGVSASADLVVQGRNGCLYAAGDVAALRSALESLLRNPQQRLEMGRKSLEIVRGWSQEESVRGICRAISLVSAEGNHLRR